MYQIPSFPVPSIEKNKIIKWNKKFHTETKYSRIRWIEKALRFGRVPYETFWDENWMCLVVRTDFELNWSEWD